ncbi:retrovirus-related pol polyprotein from transposon TNT 1-94 [Tanacetum coccineum]
MPGNVPPIPPPLGTSTSNPTSPNRTDIIPVDITNNTTTTNVAQNVVNEDLPQLLDLRVVKNVPAFDVEDFSSWKDRFLVYLDRLEPCLIEILENIPFVPMSPLSTFTNQLTKPKKQWSPEDRKLANQDKRLKILPHEGPSDTRDTKIVALRLKFNAFKALEGEKVNGTFIRLKCLLNDLENNGVSISQVEINVTFVNSLPRKWLNVEEYTKSSSEFLANLNTEFHDRALIANQKRFYKRSERVRSVKKTMDKSNETCFTCGKLGHFQNECPITKTSTPSYPSSNKSYNKLKFYINSTPQQSQNVDNHQKDYKGKYKGLKAEIDILTRKIDSLSNGVTKVKAFMVIAEKEPSVGKNDARSGQWVEITMKKVQRLLSMTDGDERKHVFDYTHVDLHYVEDQRKNLLSKFNSLNQELSSCKSELADLKNTKALNCSLQDDIARLNMENESQRDEISDLKKVIDKWISRGRGKRNDTISSKEVLFSKVVESPYETVPKSTYNSKYECGNLESLPPLPKLTGVEPIGTSADVLTLTDLTLTPSVFEETIKVHDKKLAVKAPKKKAQTMSPSALKPIYVKIADSSTEKLLLTLMEEVKDLKEQIKIPSNTSPSVSLSGSFKSAKGKQKAWFGPCKHYGFRNHLLEDSYIKTKCSTYGSTGHLTKEHPEQADVRKTLSKLKA